MSVERRRILPPWDIEDNVACFIVRDHNGQALAYTYYEQEAGRRTAANLLTRDDARGIAANIAKLRTYCAPSSRKPMRLFSGDRGQGTNLAQARLTTGNADPFSR